MRLSLIKVIAVCLLLTFGNLSEASDKSLLEKCEESLIGIRPRVGLASSKLDNFDVRIISQWGARSRWTNKELEEAAIENVTSLRASLMQLGFNSSHYLNVLVEKHPGAVRSGLYREIGSALIVGGLGFLEIPNIIGVRSLYLGSINKGDTFETMPRQLLLKALSPDYNSVFSPFTIAHEIAHDTERPNSPQSLIWIEARADFLAFAVTGENSKFWPAGIGLHAFDSSGRMIVADLPVGRSLSSPKIKTLKDLIGNKHAYHENSELISSMLFRLGSEFGMEAPLEFIRWMDQQSSTAQLDLETHLSKNLQDEYGPEFKRAWSEVINAFFDLYIKWSSAQPNGLIHSRILSQVEGVRG